MSAGVPNWTKLAEIGKLPNDQRDKVPFFAQLDESENKIEKIKEEVCDECRERVFGIKKLVEEKSVKKIDSTEPLKKVELKCEVEGCDYVSVAKTKEISKKLLNAHNKIAHKLKE